MTAVRANWHLDLAAHYDSDDPFGGDQLSIEEVGDVLDLSSSHAVLSERLATLLNAEGALWNANVRCKIKQDFSDTSCSACPLRRQSEADPLHELCEVGVEQEKVMTLMRVRQEADAYGDHRPDA